MVAELPFRTGGRLTDTGAAPPTGNRLRSRLAGRDVTAGRAAHQRSIWRGWGRARARCAVLRRAARRLCLSRSPCAAPATPCLQDQSQCRRRPVARPWLAPVDPVLSPRASGAWARLMSPGIAGSKSRRPYSLRDGSLIWEPPPRLSAMTLRFTGVSKAWFIYKTVYDQREHELCFYVKNVHH